MNQTEAAISPWRVRVFKSVLLLICLVFGEGAAWYVLGSRLPHWDTARRGLAGQGEASFQNMVGQSYLNFVPSPNYGNGYGRQHNAHGYRGEQVPVMKAPESLRILCLGGSTTYGWAVRGADATYPAQLQRLLAADLPAGYRKVEVINAGLAWGTSAELVNHYHFKYHYYRPDIVIVHTGLNDAQAFDMKTYQPDYAHWRQQMRFPVVLPPATRWLARSRLVGLLLVPALLGLHPEVPTFNRPWLKKPDIDWYEGNRFDRREPGKVPEERIAFLHNIRGLVHEIQRDGAIALLMPVEFRSAGVSESELEKQVRFSGNSLRYTRYNARLLRKIADESKSTFVPFPHADLEPSHWAEVVHLLPGGTLIKARHVAAFVAQALRDPAISRQPSGRR